MKTFLASALLALSFNVSAFEQSAILDFSKLYGKTNVGVYQMTAKFTQKTTKSESTLSFNVHQDDGYFTCNTTANFEIGQLEVTLKNIGNGKTYKVSNPVIAGVTKTVDGQECDTSIENLAGKQIVYSQIGPKTAILLDVAAPYDYEAVGVWLAPFNGYLNLESDLTVVGNKLVMDPSDLLTKRSILSTNTQNASVTYYVFAQKESTTLSLGNGLIKF